MSGIVPESPGLERARSLGVEASTRASTRCSRATTSSWCSTRRARAAHLASAPLLAEAGKRTVDLTPAAVGPFVVPSVNLDESPRRGQREHDQLRRAGDDPDRACARARGPPRDAETVSTIAAPARGSGHAAEHRRIHETTAAASSWSAVHAGKAIIILNPAEPPILMRNTVYATVADADRGRDQRVAEMVEACRPTSRLPPDADRVRGDAVGVSLRSRAPATTCRRTPATSTS